MTPDRQQVTECQFEIGILTCVTDMDSFTIAIEDFNLEWNEQGIFARYKLPENIEPFMVLEILIRHNRDTDGIAPALISLGQYLGYSEAYSEYNFKAKFC